MARHKCPKCGSRNNASLYSGMIGMPTPGQELAVALGRVRYTGCVIENPSPRWACNGCNVLFGFEGEQPGGFTWLEDSDLAAKVDSPEN